MVTTTAGAGTMVGVPVITGAPFVPPYVFQEQERLAVDVATQQTAKDHYLDANQHNLRKLRVSVFPQPTIWEMQPLLPESEVADFRVYDAKHQTKEDFIFTSRNLVRSKGEDPVSDEMVNIAYERLYESLSFYLEVLGLHSVDARGLMLSAAVHVGVKYNNAYYYNERTCFGDGDGVIFKEFIRDLSVVAHELGHAVVELCLGGLTYWSQSGALNESFADVLGISAYQYAMGEKPDVNATWIVGAKCMVPYEQDGKMVQPALRSFSAPGTAYVNHPRIGTDPQSPTMDGYYRGSGDNYGVHINSGIPNHAYYLAATQIKDDPWQTIIPVWLEAAKSLGKNPSFADFAQRTIEKAQEMFPDKPEIKLAIENAWEQVKVLGENAIKIDMAYEIPEGPDRDEIISIFNLDESQIEAMEQAVLQSALPGTEGVKRCKVGFVLDENLNANLVCIAYVQEEPKVDLSELAGIRVHTFKI